MRLFRKKKQEEGNEELKQILAYLQRQEEAEIKLSVRAIVMFEALGGKAFSSMDDGEDMLTLMYCAFVCSTGMEVSKDIFIAMLGNERFAAKLDKDMKRLQAFSEQFKQKEEKEEGDKKSGDTTEVSITEMADKLIFAYGIDPQYVYERMQLWEISHFLDGAEKQYKERMEEQRLWTFLQVAPQIDLKKCKSPEKFIPFPWDKAEKDAKMKEELKREAERAAATIGMTF